MPKRAPQVARTYFEHLHTAKYAQNVPNELIELLEPILNTYIPQSTRSKCIDLKKIFFREKINLRKKVI